MAKCGAAQRARQKRGYAPERSIDACGAASNSRRPDVMVAICAAYVRYTRFESVGTSRRLAWLVDKLVDHNDGAFIETHAGSVKPQEARAAARGAYRALQHGLRCKPAGAHGAARAALAVGVAAAGAARDAAQVGPVVRAGIPAIGARVRPARRGRRGCREPVLLSRASPRRVCAVRRLGQHAQPRGERPRGDADAARLPGPARAGAEADARRAGRGDARPRRRATPLPRVVQRGRDGARDAPRVLCLGAAAAVGRRARSEPRRGSNPFPHRLASCCSTFRARALNRRLRPPLAGRLEPARLSSPARGEPRPHLPSIAARRDAAHLRARRGRGGAARAVARLRAAAAPALAHGRQARRERAPRARAA
eukprot:5329235-Prymnesium_polylepis.2